MATGTLLAVLEVMLGQGTRVAKFALIQATRSASIATPKSRRALAMATCAALFGASSLGCGPGYHWSSQAFFANATREPVSVRVQTLKAAVDCKTARGRSAELLAHRELFGEPVMYRVPAGEALPLEIDEGFATSGESCAVLLQLIGFPDQVVLWPELGGTSTASKMAETSDPAFRRHSLILEGYADIKELAIGDNLEVTPLPPANSGEAPFDEAPALLGWSGSRVGNGLILAQKQVLPDGCLSLELTNAQQSSSLFVCAPDWSFPFLQGDELNVNVSSGYLQVRANPGPKLEIWLNTSETAVPNVVSGITQLGPPGRRTACGAYVEPFSVALPLFGTSLSPGQEAESSRSGRHLHALLGRADNVLVAPSGCGPEYASLGSRFDLLLLETAEDLP